MAPKEWLTLRESEYLLDSNFYERLTKSEISLFQLHTSRTCIPFQIFSDAVDSEVDFDTSTISFAIDHDKLVEKVGEADLENLTFLLRESNERELIIQKNSQFIK